jgi:hypothetical protein
LLDICWCLWHLTLCRGLLLCFQCKLLDYQVESMPSKLQWRDFMTDVQWTRSW